MPSENEYSECDSLAGKRRESNLSNTTATWRKRFLAFLLLDAVFFIAALVALSFTPAANTAFAFALLACFRMLVLGVAYLLYGMQHWVPISVTAGLTSAAFFLQLLQTAEELGHLLDLLVAFCSLVFAFAELPLLQQTFSKRTCSRHQLLNSGFIEEGRTKTQKTTTSLTASSLSLGVKTNHSSKPLVKVEDDLPSSAAAPFVKGAVTVGAPTTLLLGSGIAHHFNHYAPAPGSHDRDSQDSSEDADDALPYDFLGIDEVEARLKLHDDADISVVREDHVLATSKGAEDLSRESPNLSRSGSALEVITEDDEKPDVPEPLPPPSTPPHFQIPTIAIQEDTDDFTPSSHYYENVESEREEERLETHNMSYADSSDDEAHEEPRFEEFEEHYEDHTSGPFGEDDNKHEDL